MLGQPYHLVNKKIKFNTFAVKMLVIDRYFNIDAARRDLHYTPLIEFRAGWEETKRWFKDNWLPKTEFANGRQPKKSGGNTLAFFAVGLIIPLLLMLLLQKA